MLNKLKWVSSEIPENTKVLDKLSMQMQGFYATNNSYYDNIHDSESYWVDQKHLIHQHILSELKYGKQILELGCGESPILKFHSSLQENYTGLDFSEKIIKKNRDRFPKASFVTISDPYKYDIPSNSFDIIFSVFVIEHTVFPQRFLEECIRLLKEGGKIILLAPNFLDHGFLPSENVNMEIKSGRELLKAGKPIKAFKTFFYNKILIPLKCYQASKRNAGFYINTDPVCFYTNVFKPDVDAVYVVSEIEIDNYMLKRGFECQKLPQEIILFKRANRFVYQVYKKKI